MLVAVQENPLATIEELSIETGISKPTVAKRMRILEGIQPRKKAQFHSEGRYFTTTPVIDNTALGLELYNVLVETKSQQQIETMEKIADAHPYTQYSVRCFGKHNGLYMQFRVPLGTNHLLEDLLKHLKREDIINEFNSLPQEKTPTIYSNLSVKGWDAAKMTWKFDIDDWFRFKSHKKPKVREKREPGTALEWITKRDIHIIHELMGGARRKNLQIIDALSRKGIEFTPQTFSRRYKMIQKDCFNGYRTNFDSSIFDVYNTVIITGNGNSEFLNDLRRNLIVNPFPFYSTLRIVDEHLFWFLRLQSFHLSKLVSNLFTNLNDIAVYLADYSSSKAYYVWPDAFDDEQQGWIKDREFIVDDILELLK